jgi:hypothetical protein
MLIPPDGRFNDPNRTLQRSAEGSDLAMSRHSQSIREQLSMVSTKLVAACA